MAADDDIVQFDAQFLSDPDAAYAALRAEKPVHRAVTPDGSPVWLVTRYDDVRAALADPRLSLNKRNAGGGYQGFALPSALDANLLNMDAPNHTRLRSILGRGFTRARVEGLRPRIRESAVELLAALPDTGEVDLIEAFAAPLPITVICELLGISAEERPDFRSWTDQMLAPARPEDLGIAMESLWQYLVRLAAVKRATPGDDLISALIEERDVDDRMSEEELISALFLILGAGYENVVHQIGNGLAAVLTRPQILARLREDHTLLSSTVEELVRFTSPAQLAIRRFPTVDVAIGGVTIPAGDTVMLSLASADRDPDRFPDPEVLDPNRAGNSHLGFGHGPHYCIGAPLARIEIEVGLVALLDRYPELALALPYDQLRWRPSFRNRGLLALPVRVGALPSGGADGPLSTPTAAS
ncbi:cytochrome P450 [Amycolatopsis roodepoortensis]|uniref:cytochrome P450 family protein n=1 Tax=Amycolatopsis roodepoortensis TaxID=700274 RepID=UPI00214B4BEF|nr:cytochrome P450 [Amycolatopsis roodepoortensis]UUV32067.1 cytochrome P450 [Amycolatopsis roodepoortensis]